MSRPWRPARLWAGAALLAACAADPAAEARPVDLGPETACAVDGMLLGGHDGPKAQVQRRDGGRAFFCAPGEAFQEWLDPVRRRRVAGLWFQTVDDAPWEAHAGGWSPAADLLFVAGSRRLGAMGPTLAPFRGAAAAQAFVERYGGRILRFEEVDEDCLRQLRRQGMDALQ